MRSSLFTTLTSMDTMLVTGGAGFIGSNFVRYMRAHYPHIHIIVLDALTYAGNLSNISELMSDEIDNPVEFVKGSINDEAIVDSLVSRVDTVVHFAAESHNDRAIEDPDIFFTTNVMGTLALVKAATRYGVRFHHISTDEVYGDTSLDSQLLFTEDSTYRPSSPYAASKAASDHIVRAWVRTYGLKATISNCSNNFGPYQHIEKFIPRSITNLLSGMPIKIYGDGLAIRDWIHVEDQCEAIWRVLTRGKIGQTYLIGANCTVSNKYIAEQLQSVFNDTNFMSSLQSVSSISVPEIEYVRDRIGADRRYALDASKLRDSLGWQPQHNNFVKELREVVRWYATHRSWWEHSKDGVEAQYSRRGQ